MASSFLYTSNNGSGTVAVGAGTLNSSTVAPKPAASKALRVAAVFPTHSITTSAPLLPAASRTRADRSSRSGSTARSAPTDSPALRRSSTGSLRMTFAAPERRASCTISRPMAPPPITHTVLPGRIPAASIPCRQHASGSAMAPASKGSSGASLKHCAAGAALYCANPPSRVTPSACRCSQNCFLPSRQGVQAPQ